MDADKNSASWLTHPIIAFVLRISLGCVFIYASLDKIIHPDFFAEAVYNYQLSPEVAVNLVAIWLPWLEFWCGVLLVLGLWVGGSILILSGLLLVFLSAIGINLARGLDIHCGCFTTRGTHSMTIFTLFRDFSFLFVALYLFWLYQIKSVQVKFSLSGVFQGNNSKHLSNEQ
jgi:uncharacterized membrane protein YphA (DoxX/SURF4 family)